VRLASDGERELVPATWGFPLLQNGYAPKPVTNVRAGLGQRHVGRHRWTVHPSRDGVFVRRGWFDALLDKLTDRFVLLSLSRSSSH
jgi:hypothetical protein